MNTEKDVVPVAGLYENWFLDYASYVILERAVPALEDGLKPVQRRILHAMKQMDDGRYHKVANIVGQAMQYHPHGDASIYEALVNLGQKGLLIDTQGNWGDIRTGDSAAAARYIEARLTPFAKEVLFNAELTEWQLSYDGRKKEPVTLPVKFPLILFLGVEGIAVGLSTTILPHNFCELIEASIDVLKGKKPVLYPDFPTGGLMDVSQYTGEGKGDRIRLRADIEIVDKKTLAIRSVPYGVTTGRLIDSILKANDKGKIKIKQIIDNTAEEVEILVKLTGEVSPEVTMDALYAFTDCEKTLYPNYWVLHEGKPVNLSVSDILRLSTERTKELLRRELELAKQRLQEKILFASLERIFIENRIYRKIENAETWEAVIETIRKGLKPYAKEFYREITDEDIVRLTEIKIKRISKYDLDKADEQLRAYRKELEEVEDNLAHLTRYAVNYFKNLLKTYGKGQERKTQITVFGEIKATEVVANNQKLYVNRQEGFIGYGLKKDEYVCDCSDIDDIIVFREDGKCLVTKIGEKVFVGKDILHVAVFRKGDKRMVYNLIYRDGKSGTSYAKRFQVLAVTRDREYDLTQGTPGSKVLYFTANPNGEAERVKVQLTQSCRAKNKIFEFDFAGLAIKGRNSKGNILTKYPVKKITKISEGVSTLGDPEYWYDPLTGEVNMDGRGQYLGKLPQDAQLIAVYQDGTYEVRTIEEDKRRYDERSLLVIAPFNEQTTVTAIYYHAKRKEYLIKRFGIETSTLERRFSFLPDGEGHELIFASLSPSVSAEVTYKGKDKKTKTFVFELDEICEPKSYRVVGEPFPVQDILEVKEVRQEVSEEEE
ncbi:MAG: DNA topoisomerase IV subunit A [Thermonema sp.]|uniref:DNA gyrase/topoisomerase IV subunit A n=1 Tax=Thermonema sp. TaxID=2231181 RepID=UPI0021DB9E51|nr:DNA gyrase/topoisomerase IV subunit A [Thermonema sp.]GIV40455.1 MAG: DNA topoisomerase IV subunit A [Thermonema sp.]